MATFTKQALSGSTNGKQIQISGTGSGSANTIHTAVTGTSSWDEIWIYAYNDDAVAHLLTIFFGGTSDPANAIRVTIQPRSGRQLVLDGMILQNSLVVKAYADTTNVVMLDGFVNNIM